MFADDTKIYRTISSNEDSTLLQSDLRIIMSRHASIIKGSGTGTAGPVLAGPLFQRASNTFAQTKKQMHDKQILILGT